MGLTPEHRFIQSLLLGALSVLGSGCAPHAPPPPPKPAVTVVELRARPVSLTTELPGRVSDPEGLPSDLLTHRPDILSAEHTLRAANANIGAARAAFSPRSSSLLPAARQADGSATSLESGTGTWTFAPTITLPIFNGGRNVANLDLAHIEKNEAIAHYELAIQTAFREVSDALSARGTYVEQHRAQEDLVTADTEAFRLAQMRFRSGVDSYLTTLDAERSLYSAQQGLVTVRQAELANEVTLSRPSAAVGTRTRVRVDRQPRTAAHRTRRAQRCTIGKRSINLRLLVRMRCGTITRDATLGGPWPYMSGEIRRGFAGLEAFLGRARHPPAGESSHCAARGRGSSRARPRVACLSQEENFFGRFTVSSYRFG